MALLLAFALLATAAVSFLPSHLAVAGAVQVATGSSIAETAVANFHFSPVEFVQVPANTTINVTFTNGDGSGLPHTFTILNRSEWVIPSSTSPSDLTSLLSTWGNLTSLRADKGQTVQASFSAPAPGWYEFVCAVAGHFQEGMYGFIAFGEDLPANLSVGGGAMGPGFAVFVIVGTVVALTVVAIVLGFVIGRRRGAVHEMPPERLGYPEPSTTGEVPSPPEPPQAPPPS